MYIRPDFLLVSVKMKDVFASYNTRCACDEGNLYTLGGGADCRELDMGYQLYTAVYVGNGCYSTMIP